MKIKAFLILDGKSGIGVLNLEKIFPRQADVMAVDEWADASLSGAGPVQPFICRRSVRHFAFRPVGIDMIPVLGYKYS